MHQENRQQAVPSHGNVGIPSQTRSGRWNAVQVRRWEVIDKREIRDKSQQQGWIANHTPVIASVSELQQQRERMAYRQRQYKTLGRWKSSAYLLYIRMPREELVGVSKLISQP